jgi:hypothetical protein
MDIIQIDKKERHTNITEICHIYCTYKHNKQMNEVFFDLKNPIFDIIHNHYRPHYIPHHKTEAPTYTTISINTQAQTLKTSVSDNHTPRQDTTHKVRVTLK